MLIKGIYIFIDLFKMINKEKMRSEQMELVVHCYLNKKRREGEGRRRRNAGVTYLCKKSNMLAHTSLVFTVGWSGAALPVETWLCAAAILTLANNHTTSSQLYIRNLPFQSDYKPPEQDTRETVDRRITERETKMVSDRRKSRYFSDCYRA